MKPQLNWYDRQMDRQFDWLASRDKEVVGNTGFHTSGGEGEEAELSWICQYISMTLEARFN